MGHNNFLLLANFAVKRKNVTFVFAFQLITKSLSGGHCTSSENPKVTGLTPGLKEISVYLIFRLSIRTKAWRYTNRMEASYSNLSKVQIYAIKTSCIYNTNSIKVLKQL